MNWMLGKFFGVGMKKTADKLMTVGMCPFLIFGVFFGSALIGDIRGTMSIEQVRAIAQWSILPLFLAATLIVPACFMPINPRVRSN
jgi:hypothetical protein